MNVNLILVLCTLKVYFVGIFRAKERIFYFAFYILDDTVKTEIIINFIFFLSPVKKVHKLFSWECFLLVSHHSKRRRVTPSLVINCIRERWI